MTDAYLAWRYREVADNSEASTPSAEQQIPGNTSSDEDIPTQYSVKAIDLWSLRTTLTIWRTPQSVSAAIDLMSSGYMATSPVSPTQAISIKTLQHFHILRCRKPSFSVEAFAKVLCDHYNVCHALFFECLYVVSYTLNQRFHMSVGIVKH